MIKNKNSGFTIVELLVVIVVIGILAAITMVSYSGITTKANQTKLTSDLKNAATQLEVAKAVNNGYPTTTDQINDGKGLLPSGGVLFSYNYHNADHYCLSASLGSINYHVVSSDQTPTNGGCPIVSGMYFNTTRGNTSDNYVITNTSDGGYIIAGSTRAGGNGIDKYDQFDVLVIKVSADGFVSWTKTYDILGVQEVGVAWVEDKAHAIIQAKDGGYVIVGEYYKSSSYKYNAFALKLTQEGNVAWTRTFDNSNRSDAIVESSDGSLLIAGMSLANSDNTSLVKLNASGGVLWSKDIINLRSDRTSLIKTSDGGYAIMGRGQGYPSLIKLDNNGNITWSKTINKSCSTYYMSLIQTNENGYVMSSNCFNNATGSDDIFLAKFSSIGDLSWFRFIGGPGLERDSYIMQADDGGYVFSGRTSSFKENYDDGAWITKVNSNGGYVWSKLLDYSDDTDQAFSLVKTNSNGVALVGVKDFNTLFLTFFDKSGYTSVCNKLTVCKSINPIITDYVASLNSTYNPVINTTSVVSTSPNTLETTNSIVVSNI